MMISVLLIVVALLGAPLFAVIAASALAGFYSEEIDLQVGYKFNKRFRADLYLAEFDGDSFGDVTKFWVQLYFKL